MMEPLSLYESPELWDELTGPIKSLFFTSEMIEIHLFCTCDGCGNDT